MTGTPTSAAQAWSRAAITPLLWLALALLVASAFALALPAALAVGPGAGAWNPMWSFAEVRIPELDADDARALAEEADPGHPGLLVESRPADGGAWIVLVGPADRQELLSALRAFVGPYGHVPDQVGFGSNLARITARLLKEPSEIVDALEGLLPSTLLGGSLVLLVFGAVLRRRLPDEPLPAPGATGSTSRRVWTGVVLGLFLALCVEGIAAGMAALGYPIVEQAWVVDLIERGGVELYATLPMIVLVAPVAEEVFFRGYLLPALVQGWGRLGSLVLSSIAFAAVHGHGPALPAYFFYGLGLALAARRWRTLLVPVVAHTTVNALAMATLWLGRS